MPNRPKVDTVVPKRPKVDTVVPNRPKKKGGLKENDLIISINNEKISTPADVVQKINRNNLKSNLKIKILRENIESIKIIKPIDIYDLQL